VDLVPLSPAHAPELLAVADERCFQFLWDVPRTWDEAGFRAYIERSIASAGRVALAIISRDSGRAVGTSSFIDMQPEHRGVEIGFTWIAPAARGTRVNPESKLLMMTHAFEEKSAVRVQLKCDARNVQSQAAIRKLGAVREGVLRKHRILPDGYIRDTVMFSITAGEWPLVKHALGERLRA
jgi:RimJ/RimL family protein N-acetyltransferase